MRRRRKSVRDRHVSAYRKALCQKARKWRRAAAKLRGRTRMERRAMNKQVWADLTDEQSQELVQILSHE